MNITTPQDWLQDQLFKRQQKNSRYSMRAFSKDLDINQSRISEYLSGKRSITLQAAEKIGQQLRISQEERERFFKLVEADKKRKENLKKFYRVAEGPSRAKKVSEEEFEPISDPIYSGLLCLLETVNCQSDPAWLGKRLGVTPEVIERALRILQEQNYIKKDGHGNYSLTFEHGLKTSSDIPSEVIRSHHHSKLDFAKRSLEETNIDLRDITSQTFAVNPKHLSEAKKIIREFRHRMGQLLEQGDKHEVYDLNIQLVPRTVLSLNAREEVLTSEKGAQ